MSILVTGGGGFVGSHVCDYLAENGDEVVSFDLKFPELEERKMSNIRKELGDVTQLQNLVDVVRKLGVNRIVSAAAISGSDKCAAVPLRAFQVNVLGTANALECARLTDVERIIFVSSNSVYGRRSDLQPMKEDDHPNPDTIYRRSKLLGEEVCEMYRANYAVKATSVRLGVVYGPRNAYYHTPNIPTRLLYHALTKRKLKLPRGAEDRLDHVYAQDVARGISGILARTTPKNNVYNVASGVSLSLLDAAELVRDIIPDFEYEIGPGYSSEHDKWVQGPLDITRVSADLGYEPTPIEECFSQYANWLRAHPDELNRIGRY